MIILYPCDILDPRQADAQFMPEVMAFEEAGFGTGIIDLDGLETGPAKIKRTNVEHQTVLYRGWMITPAGYANLEASVKQSGGTPLTNLATYQRCHYLPNWYPLIQEHTPQTAIFPLDERLTAKIAALGWQGYFIKDYVKSLKTDRGSKITHPEEVAEVIAAMEHYRGSIEGGVCVRQLEDILPETEQRYFVINGQAYGPNPKQAIPTIVEEAAARIDSPFFSVDVALRRDGVERIIEIGDGQVSDLVGWTTERFVSIWQTI